MTIRINEEAVERLANAYRAIGESFLNGAIRLGEHMRLTAQLSRLERLPDPWLRVWALHLSQTTWRDLDTAIDHVWFRIGSEEFDHA